jgi:DNA-binding CsgD family transcriptional regulator
MEIELGEALTAGLVMAGVFSWIFAFPWFGPLGQAAHGYPGFLWTYVFGFAHGAGYLVFSHPAWRRIWGFSQVFAAGLSILVLTAVIVLLPLPFWLVFLLFVTVGLAAAYLVMAWSPWFARQSRPAVSLLTLMIGADGFTLLVSKAAARHPDWLAFMTMAAGLLLFVGTSFLSRAMRVEGGAGEPAGPQVDGERDPRAIAALGAFGFTGYVIAGLMFRLVSPAAHARWPDADVWGTLLYLVGAGLVAFYGQRRSLPQLSVMILSTLGLGWVFFSLVGNSPQVIFYSYLIIYYGLGGVDAFFWLSLWTLARKYGVRRTFGIGLGLNVLVIAGTGQLLNSGLLKNPLQEPVMQVIALIIVLLTIPFVGPNTPAFHRQPSGPRPEDARPETNQPPPVQSPPSVPYLAQLTPAESRILPLLIKGQSDLVIAEQLFVSPNTVRFHVRNILRKAGVPNRKELMAGMIRDPSVNG